MEWRATVGPYGSEWAKQGACALLHLEKRRREPWWYHLPDLDKTEDVVPGQADGRLDARR